MRVDQLWGKTNQNLADRHYQPLLYHMLDVAAVAGIVWDHCLGPASPDTGRQDLNIELSSSSSFLRNCSGTSRDFLFASHNVAAITRSAWKFN